MPGGTRAARSGQGPSQIVLHGHCHQKAMGLLAPAKALLGRIPGATVVDLDAGCCGMAGSFGYAREHFEVSRAIGERRLLPAARSLDAGAVLVAGGTSCRHQVADFTGVRALHPGAIADPCALNPRDAREAPCMSLAVISVCALALAVVVSCVSRLNVGVLAVALAWIVGVYIGGMPVTTVMSGFPEPAVPDAGRCHAAVHARAVERHARPARPPRGARAAAATAGRIPIMFFVLGAALRRSGPGNIATAALLAPMAMATAVRPASRCF